MSNAGVMLCAERPGHLMKNSPGSPSIPVGSGCGKEPPVAKALKCTLNSKYPAHPADVNRTTCMLKCFAELVVD